MRGVSTIILAIVAAACGTTEARCPGCEPLVGEATCPQDPPQRTHAEACELLRVAECGHSVDCGGADTWMREQCLRWISEVAGDCAAFSGADICAEGETYDVRAHVRCAEQIEAIDCDELALLEGAVGEGRAFLLVAPACGDICR